MEGNTSSQPPNMQLPKMGVETKLKQQNKRSLPKNQKGQNGNLNNKKNPAEVVKNHSNPRPPQDGSNETDLTMIPH